MRLLNVLKHIKIWQFPLTIVFRILIISVVIYVIHTAGEPPNLVKIIIPFLALAYLSYPILMELIQFQENEELRKMQENIGLK
ncbi:MAG: hypothetical protein ACXABK_06630 [Candidatus Heimdallarchaeaceae archaeon]|jgi:hypothetical protein